MPRGVRSERKAMRLPSGDTFGSRSSAGSLVSRIADPPVDCCTQMSRLPSPLRSVVYAINPPSALMLGSVVNPESDVSRSRGPMLGPDDGRGAASLHSTPPITPRREQARRSDSTPPVRSDGEAPARRCRPVSLPRPAQPRSRAAHRRCRAAAASDPCRGSAAAAAGCSWRVAAGSRLQSGSRSRIGGERVGDRLAAERGAAGEHLVEHAAERPDVGALVDGLAARLLGTHVGGRAEDHALARAGDRDGRRVREIRTGAVARRRLRQAEVEHLDRRRRA